MSYRYSVVDGSDLDSIKSADDIFYFPRIARTFASPMIRLENLRANRDARDYDVVQWIIAGMKPIAFVEHFAALVLISGGVVRIWAIDQLGPLYGVTLGGQIGDIFHMDDLITDYRAYLPEAPTVADSIECEILQMADRRLEDYLDFHKVGGAITPAELARAGLLLGYPIESTVALIRQDLRLSGGILPA